VLRDLIGYSRAMYANWIWHRRLQLVVDAGEGLQLALGSHVFGPSWVAITHGHSDHVLGLPGLIAARRFGKGATDKPLTVLHPEGSRGVQGARDFLAGVYPGVAFPVTWMPVAPGASVPIGGGRMRLEAFLVRHTSELALGYRVVESRRRLKREYASRPQAEVEALARSGRRDDMMEPYDHVVFAHSGDAMPVDVHLVKSADLLVHDATFLHEADRREPIHATTGEALQVAAQAGVRALVINHLSIRYDRATALPTLRAQVAGSGFAGECWLLDEDRFVALRS
jgi:ribonuclease Z